MALNVAFVTGAELNTANDQTSYTVPSVTFTNGRYYLLAVVGNKTTGTPDTINSITNSQVAFTSVGSVLSSSGGTAARTTILSGACSSTGSSSTVVDFNSVTQHGFNGTVFEVTGHNTTTPIRAVGPYTNAQDGVGSGTPFTVTVGALASTLNAIFGVFTCTSNGVLTVQNSYNEIYDNGHLNPAARLGVAWLINGGDPGFSRGASADWGGIAIELNEASVGGGSVFTPRLTLLGVG